MVRTEGGVAAGRERPKATLSRPRDRGQWHPRTLSGPPPDMFHPTPQISLLLLAGASALAQCAPIRGPEGSSPRETLRTDWTDWWEVDKGLFTIHIRIPPDSPPPGPESPRLPRDHLDAQIHESVIRALEQALAGARERDLRSSCLIALARIGRSKALRQILEDHSVHADPTIAEAALLALGISAQVESTPRLLELFSGTSGGGELAGGTAGVSVRKRAFAGYALGLIARATLDGAVKRAVFEAAMKILNGRSAGPDLPVAAIEAMGLLGLDPQEPKDAPLVMEACRSLIDCLRSEEISPRVRAHAPAAVASLLGKHPARPRGRSRLDEPARSLRLRTATLRAEAVDLFLKILHTENEDALVVRSCAMARGRIAQSCDRHGVETLARTASGALWSASQINNYALLSLGFLGGPVARADLVERLRKPGSGPGIPWIALALGVMAREDGEIDPEIGAALVDAFAQTGNPSWKAGIAVALGLTRHREAGRRLQEEMRAAKDPQLRGYCAGARGLMNFHEAEEDVCVLMEQSTDRPGLFRLANFGLGLMGGKYSVQRLLALLANPELDPGIAAIVASELGRLGDPRVCHDLVGLLLGEENAGPRRICAANALGLIGGGMGLPWAVSLGIGLDHQASVATFAEAADILGPP